MTNSETYIDLQKQTFSIGDFSIVPIRFQDRLKIMNWRNEQLYHLRQQTVLTKDSQDHYFSTVISRLFETKKPSQLLFSFLEKDKCIGYGGLVHISWTDKNAEISFIMDTSLETTSFKTHWITFLKLIEKVAFQELDFHKIYTYAFDLRPHLYPVLEHSGYIKEAVLKAHFFYDSLYKDIVIHSKKNQLHAIKFREVNQSDLQLLFEWRNDDLVRKQSFNTEVVNFKNHTKWFKNMLIQDHYRSYIFEINKESVGLVKLESLDLFTKIGISINKNFRGKGLAPIILRIGCEEHFKYSDLPIHAYIKTTNTASISSFKNAGFIALDNTSVQESTSCVYKLEK